MAEHATYFVDKANYVTAKKLIDFKQITTR